MLNVSSISDVSILAVRELSKHRPCARIATSFEVRTDLPRTVLHHLSPRPAPSASQPLYHTCPPSSPSSLPSPSSSAWLATVVALRCVVNSVKHPPPLLSLFSLPTAVVDRTCCAAFVATAVSPSHDWLEEVGCLVALRVGSEWASAPAILLAVTQL